MYRNYFYSSLYVNVKNRPKKKKEKNNNDKKVLFIRAVI